MSPAGRFLAIACGWSLMKMALSIDFDPSGFLSDDSGLSTTDSSSDSGGFSPDFFTGLDSVSSQAGLDYSIGTDPSSTEGDPLWLSLDDQSDGSDLEASCAGDGSPSMGKARRQDQPMCFQKPKKTSPDFSRLKLPNLLQLEPGSGNAEGEFKVKLWLDGDGGNDCPDSHSRRLCCTGPGVQSFPVSELWDFVQGCLPCMCPSPNPVCAKYGVHTFAVHTPYIQIRKLIWLTWW